MTWLFVCLSLAIASEDGKTGKAETGCKSCHGPTEASSTSVDWVVADAVVQPGETITVDFIVSTTDSKHTAAGLNVAATAGAFTAGTNNKVDKGEITHKRAEDMISAETVFSFEWTAPTAAGIVTLFGSGNAVNNDGQKSGDGWAIAEPLEILVESDDDDDTGAPDDTGTPADTDDTDTDTDTDTDANGDDDNNDTDKSDAGGCNTSQTPLQWYGWLTVLAILGLSRRHSAHTRQRVQRVYTRRS